MGDFFKTWFVFLVFCGTLFAQSPVYLSPSYLSILDEVPMEVELKSSNFYVRYIEGKYGKTIVKEVMDDDGNVSAVLSPPEIDEMMYFKEPRVDYVGEKHWNVKRFIYDVYFNPTVLAQLGLTKMHREATKDIYTYYLAINHDQKLSWIFATQFMVSEIDPLLKSTFHQFLNRAAAMKYFFQTDTVYDPKTKRTQLMSALQEINRTAKKEKNIQGYSKKEAFQIYYDYFLLFRKNSPNEAKKLARECLNKEWHSSKVF